MKSRAQATVIAVLGLLLSGPSSAPLSMQPQPYAVSPPTSTFSIKKPTAQGLAADEEEGTKGAVDEKGRLPATKNKQPKTPSNASSGNPATPAPSSPGKSPEVPPASSKDSKKRAQPDEAAKKPASSKPYKEGSKKSVKPAKADRYSGPAVGGFFIFTSSKAVDTQKTLKDIKKTGADTVITFGSRLQPVKTHNGIPSKAEFGSCVVKNNGCLKYLEGKVTVDNYFAYEDRGSWDSKAFVCKYDRSIHADNGDTYSVIILPTQGSCSKNVDVVISKDSSESKDANSIMIDTAKALGMKVFVGMPAPMTKADGGGLPDFTHQKSLELFTERFLNNYRLQHGKNKALAGFYHHTEMPLKTSNYWDGVRGLYAMQNRLIHQVLPSKSALISPYMDARLNYSLRTRLADVAEGTQMLLNTANGVHLILAPQDGQGTGKVGVFTSEQANKQVDIPSAQIAGKGTYRQVYEGSTEDFMKEVVRGAEGIKNVQVWANLELMTASTVGAPECSGNTMGRGKASLSRVLRQSRLGAPAGVSKTIGFMWQPYATCGSKPLGEALAKLHTEK